jgi:hypothetical protein
MEHDEDVKNVNNSLPLKACRTKLVCFECSSKYLKPYKTKWDPESMKLKDTDREKLKKETKAKIES